MGSSRIGPWLLAGAWLMGSAGTVQGEPPGAEQPNILLITIDTLRPDALGWIGGTNDTPAIDGLAAGGFRFAKAVSPVPLTLPAHTTIMTGLIPPHHGVRDNGQNVGRDLRTIGEVLTAQGYLTAAFVSGFPLDRIFGLDRGFSHYDDTFSTGREGWLERPAIDTTTAVLEFISTAGSPWFVWVHYYDPHDPYEPPREFWGPGLRGAYLGEVRYTDFAIERLMSEVGRGDGGPLLTVVTADHGEALGQHAEKRHGYFVYDSTMTVPLVFHFPGRIDGAESDASARLVDVAPTILDLVAAPPLDDIDGVSLAPLILGRDGAVPPAYIETHLPWIFYGWSPLRGIRTSEWKLIDAPRPELYHLTADVDELKNVIESEPERAAELHGLLDQIEPSAARRSSTVVDDAALARLRALGYVGVGGTPGVIPDGLPDPKDRIALRDRLQQAEALIGSGRYSEAVREFDAVLEVEPDNRCAVLRSGIAWLKGGNPKLAVPRLRRATELDPDRAEAHYALADGLMRTDDAAGAAIHWSEVTRLQPRRSDAWYNLGVAETMAGDDAEAVVALARAVEIEPYNNSYVRGLAAAEARAEMVDSSARHYAHVLETEGEKAFADAAAYGLVLVDLGEIDAALPWLRRAGATEDLYAEARLTLARLELEAGRRAAARQAVDDALAVRPDLRIDVLADPELSTLLD